MFIAAAALFGSVVVLIALVEAQRRTVHEALPALVEIEDAERTLSRVQGRLVAGSSATNVSPLLEEYRREIAYVQPTIAEISTRNAEIRARAKETTRRTETLVAAVRRLGIEGSATEREQAVNAGSAARAAVNGLHAAVARHIGLPMSQAVSYSLYGVFALSTLLLVVSTMVEIRLIHREHRLFDDLHALMESTPQVLISIDSAGNPVRWNTRLTRSSGLSNDEIRSLRIIDLFYPSNAPALYEAIAQALSHGSFECEAPLRTPGGPVDYLWVFSRNGTGSAAGITISGRDISDRRATERRLAETEARYRDLFNGMRDGAFISNESRFIEVNPALSDLFGRTRSELLALEPKELYADLEQRVPFLAAMAEGGVSDYPLRFRHKNGVVLDCVVTASTSVDANGRLRAVEGIIRDTTKQKRLEASLRQSEADYRGLFEHAHDAILLLEPETLVVLDANDRACLMYGFSHGDLVGLPMTALSVDPTREAEFMARTLEETGNYLAFESSQHRRDGSVIDVDIKAAQVIYRGRPSIVTINRDITARKREERRVRDSEERLRLLLESVVDYAIFMLDPDGLVVSWNEGAERLFGISSEEALGHSFALFYPPERRAADVPVRHLAEAAANGRIEVEEPQIRGTDETFDAAIVLTRVVDETGQLRGFAHVTRDVTERRRVEIAQKSLLATIEKVATEWTQTFDAVGTPILLLDKDRKIRRLNMAAARLAAQGVRELIGRRTNDFPGEPWTTITSCADFYLANATQIEGCAEDKATGRDWQVAASGGELGGESCVIIVVHDLTLVTQLEESLRRAEMTTTLGTLVAGVAHEVRNPLFTISATLDTYEARMGSSVPELLRYTAPLREEVNRLNGLMKDLLDYGKPQPLERAPISLAEVVRQAIAQVRGASRGELPILFDCDGAGTIVDGDQGRLEQVIRNIIENALQHEPGKGPVEIMVREEASSVFCEVLDYGRGFSPADLQRAFTPFYTRRRGGTGLGLAIARNYVTAHGGEITLSNRENGGACVSIRLPRSESAVDNLAS